MAEMDTTSPTPPKKYMRYKSVQQAESANNQPSPEKKDDTTVSRSMSRYRRPRKQIPVLSPPLPSGRIPQSHAQVSPTKSGGNARRGTDPVSTSPNLHKQPFPTRHDTVAGTRLSTRPRETEAERTQRTAREIREQEQQHRQAQLEEEAQELLRVESMAEKARQAEAEKARLLAEQKRKDLERLEAELEAATPARIASPGREKFGFFSRKRAATKTSPPAKFAPPTPPQSRSASTSISQIQSTTSALGGGKEQQFRGIEQGGGGIVPGTDAPMSASNAGERRVLVRCKQSSINLPINPGTTPKDIVYSAANIMSHDISPSAAILLESYTQLGLERRIRRYEHVRDIMNSWDRDTQNALIIQSSDSPNFDTDLEASSVPRLAPKDITVFMYHSQKPGKWNKRYITLLSSGQIFMSKKSGAKVTDKDAQSLCHLSDFDIYTPTPQETRKNLRPPKKHCYAVKSQQRTNMFESTSNFVHFFCTEMEEVAEIWYNAVQRWRSWYLVNKLGEGKKAPKTKKVDLVKRSTTRSGPGHRVKVSVDEDPYTIGTFKPLLDIDRFTKPEPDYDSEDENRPLQIPFHLRNGFPEPPRGERSRHPPPVSYRLPPEAEEEEFAASGLLGRTYSQRQNVARDREAAEKIRFQPPAELPSFTASHHRSLSVKSTRTTRAGNRPSTSAEDGGLQRNATTREPHKPLLDFKAQFKEAPQWDKSGHGHGVAAPSGVPLIEAATTPDHPLAEIATSTVFRRDATNGQRPPTSAAPRQDNAFVKGGLVSGI